MVIFIYRVYFRVTIPQFNDVMFIFSRVFISLHNKEMVQLTDKNQMSKVYLSPPPEQ
jgi:hypothetical protein